MENQWKDKLWYAYGTSMTSIQSGKYVPVVEELSGLKVVNLGIPGGSLTPDGCGKGNMKTAVFTPAQALIAAKAGADYVAPYVNRLDNILGDGCEVVAQIVEQFAIYDLPCKVLAASFKNAEQVHKCALSGCQCVTVTDDVLKAVITHPMTDAAIDGFDKDWTNVYGDKKILDF